MKYLALTIALILVGFPATLWAKDYTIDYEQSAVQFSGTHAGNTFEGAFETWEGTITFDPNDLENSKVSFEFDLSTAKTGDKMYDGTLPQADWFDVKNHPTGIFESTNITAKEDNTYSVEGTLTLCGISNPLTFDVTLSDLNETPVTAEATFEIDRLAYEIGKKSDAKAEWVSQNIALNVSIAAQ